MKALMDRMHSIALQASQRSDVVIACFTMLAIVMIIIPLPTPLVDALIALNIAISLLIFVVTFYIRHPVDFSALPPVILLATLFRLALSITTTRLILLQADAGEIVSAFGHFVVAGQVVIGLVVFFIIAIAQFVVITKGAERVAEVAARFVLDAMPGKQMSIDNDLRNGDIDAQEGRRRRDLLERESQLYGAMDGAMKFVKGDAIAVLIILFINLVGGLVVGMLEHGMPFAQAIRTYSLLTVGDGLIAQIPALLISVGAGTVVTRVSSDNKGDLGGEIMSQLGGSDRALMLTAAILAALALIPGFSTLIFLSLAAGLALAGWSVRRRRQTYQADDGAPSDSDEEQLAVSSMEPLNDDAPRSEDRVVVRLSSDVAGTLTGAEVVDCIEACRSALKTRLGMDAPSIGWAIDESLEYQQVCIDLDSVPVENAGIRIDALQVKATHVDLQAMAVDVLEPDAADPERVAFRWVPLSAAETLRANKCAYRNARDQLAARLDRVLRDHAHEFLGIQETQNRLKQMQGTHPDLVGQVLETLPVPEIAATLRRLVEEDIAISPFRTVLEALAGHGGSGKALARNTAVREALARSISHRHADGERVLHAWIISPDLERHIDEIGSEIREGRLQGFPKAFSDQLRVWLKPVLQEAHDTQHALVLCSATMRRPLFEWGQRQGRTIAVLAWSEVAQGYKVHSKGLIGSDTTDSSNAERYEDDGMGRAAHA